MSPAESKKELRRCRWAGSELSIAYHDREWGVPAHDDRTLFEFLILEGAQAGLSWEIILRKRKNYRAAFDNFDPRRIAKYDQRKIKKLLGDAGIIRNRLKIDSAVRNAKALLEIQKEFGTFDEYVWAFVKGRTIRRKRGAPSRILACRKGECQVVISASARAIISRNCGESSRPA